MPLTLQVAVSFMRILSMLPKSVIFYHLENSLLDVENKMHANGTGKKFKQILNPTWNQILRIKANVKLCNSVLR